MSRGLISCVCLTHWPKRAEALTESLQAYALQKHSPRQMLIINDGAPLRSLAPDVRVLNIEPGRTLGEKRNLGLDLADHSWAATWDDDDFALPEHLSFLLQGAMSRGLDHIYCSLYALANSRMEIGCVIRKPLEGASMLWAPTALRLGGYPHVSSAEDVAMHVKINQAKVPSGFQTRLTYIYRRHPKNITCKTGWGTGQDRRLTECLEDQKKWPRLETEQLQAYLDHCRNTPTPKLIEPIQGNLDGPNLTRHPV